MRTIMKQANGFIETEMAVETPERVDYLYKRLRVKQTEAVVETVEETVEEMKANELSTVLVEEQTETNNDRFTYKGESTEEILARIDAKVATFEAVNEALLRARKCTRKQRPKNKVQKFINAVGLDTRDVYYGLCEVEKRINKIFK